MKLFEIYCEISNDSTSSNGDEKISLIDYFLSAKTSVADSWSLIVFSYCDKISDECDN